MKRMPKSYSKEICGIKGKMLWGNICFTDQRAVNVYGVVIRWDEINWMRIVIYCCVWQHATRGDTGINSVFWYVVVTLTPSKKLETILTKLAKHAQTWRTCYSDFQISPYRNMDLLISAFIFWRLAGNTLNHFGSDYIDIKWLKWLHVPIDFRDT